MEKTANVTQAARRTARAKKSSETAATRTEAEPAQPMEIWTGTIDSFFEQGREVAGLTFKGELFPFPCNKIGIRVECEGLKERRHLLESICQAIGLEKPEQLGKGYPVRLACTYEFIPRTRHEDYAHLITIRAIGRVEPTGDAEGWCVMPVKQSAWAVRSHEQWYEVHGDWDAENLLAQLVKFEAESTIFNTSVEDITVRVKLKRGGTMEIPFSPREFEQLYDTILNINGCMSGAFDSVRPNLITARVIGGVIEVRPPILGWQATQDPKIGWFDRTSIKNERRRSRY